MLELCRAIENDDDLRRVSGIWFRENGCIVRNAKRKHIGDLDAIPFPAWDLLPMEIYINNPIWGGAARNSSGFRDDVHDLMRKSDIFVMPSRYEGLSIAMIEAMANGLPVVASDVPGLRTHIRHGYDGLLFPVEDHKAMAKCIIQLSADKKLRTLLSLGARESFEKEYDMRKNIKSLELLIREYV